MNQNVHNHWKRIDGEPLYFLWIHLHLQAFGKNYELASRQFLNAIDQVDKSIQNMQKIKEQLQKSINNLRLANNKAEDVSIKSLT